MREPPGLDPRRGGEVFDAVAADYDRHRPAYPEGLIEQACRTAGIRSGDPVLEVGCGTGQLTRSLVARGLRVTALDPGAALLALARANLDGRGPVEFVNARFEDAPLPRERFRAVLSASAFHWVDPDVSWRRAADVLVPGGTLALLQHVGLAEPRSQPDQDAALAAIAAVAPDVAAGWPTYRTLDATLAGLHRRRANISRAWSWLGGHDLGRGQAGRLFGELRAAAVPQLTEYTPDQLSALMGTLSSHARLTPDQRRALHREHEALCRRLGRPLRASTLAVLVTAPRIG